MNLDDVETKEFTGDTVAHVRRDLGTAAGSLRSGIEHVTVPPGMLNWPPHVHSLEEELFVVLDGEGVLLLGDDEHPVRAGSVVSCPAATPRGARLPRGRGAAHAARLRHARAGRPRVLPALREDQPPRRWA